MAKLTYQDLWAHAMSVRNDPKAFARAYLDLQDEIAAECWETVRVQSDWQFRQAMLKAYCVEED